MVSSCSHKLSIYLNLQQTKTGWFETELCNANFTTFYFQSGIRYVLARGTLQARREWSLSSHAVGNTQVLQAAVARFEDLHVPVIGSNPSWSAGAVVWPGKTLRLLPTFVGLERLWMLCDGWMSTNKTFTLLFTALGPDIRCRGWVLHSVILLKVKLHYTWPLLCPTRSRGHTAIASSSDPKWHTHMEVTIFSSTLWLTLKW